MKEALQPDEVLRLDPYLAHVPSWVVLELERLAVPFRGATVVHVNSTSTGGGVAEILRRLVPLQRGLGLDAHWLVIQGDADFYKMTKKLHNSLQGHPETITGPEWDHYLDVNSSNLAVARETLKSADFVVIHDPQPAAMVGLGPRPRGRWAWRCHIDLSHPQRDTWRILRTHVERHDASVFSLAAFARRLRHPQVVIPPAIDPLTEKNISLEPSEVERVRAQYGLRADVPLFLQVSRFDRFKDPVGVIEAFRLARRHRELSLVLAGGGADDDPEGQAVLEEVRRAAGDDPDIRVLDLPPDAHRVINALQRAADVVIQKSLREGFGLVVTEALWKGKPVIGGAVGGITLQVQDDFSGYLVRTVEGCAYAIRRCLRYPNRVQRMGANGVELVRGQYLITRQLRDSLMLLMLLAGRASAPVGEGVPARADGVTAA